MVEQLGKLQFQVLGLGGSVCLARGDGRGMLYEILHAKKIPRPVVGGVGHRFRNRRSIQGLGDGLRSIAVADPGSLDGKELPFLSGRELLGRGLVDLIQLGVGLLRTFRAGGEVPRRGRPRGRERVLAGSGWEPEARERAPELGWEPEAWERAPGLGREPEAWERAPGLGREPEARGAGSGVGTGAGGMGAGSGVGTGAGGTGAGSGVGTGAGGMGAGSGVGTGAGGMGAGSGVGTGAGGTGAGSGVGTGAGGTGAGSGVGTGAGGMGAGSGVGTGAAGTGAGSGVGGSGRATSSMGSGCGGSGSLSVTGSGAGSSGAGVGFGTSGRLLLGHAGLERGRAFDGGNHLVIARIFPAWRCPAWFEKPDSRPIQR